MKIERIVLVMEPTPFSKDQTQITIRTTVNGREYGVAQALYQDNDFEAKSDYLFRHMIEELKRVMRENNN